MSSKVAEGNESRDGSSIVSLLEKQVERLSKKLKNLYNLYGENADDALTETISQTRAELDETKQRLEKLKNEKMTGERAREVWKKLDSAEAAWEYMTVEEKQNVLRSCIEKIVITYNNTEIYYKILTDTGK